mmetsp:Transcript_81394/g.225400  ORF Transcript_81394/g.225400 Transcript_81394/m.225400 type:complete len:427 (-) Transcript_81394:517-1797(-)
MDGVDEDVHGGGAATQEGLPLPSVVFRIEEHVGAGDAHAHDDEAEEQQDGKHEAVYVVDLVVAPHCGQDEVHFDEEAAERHKPCSDDHRRCEQPVLCGDGPLQVVHPAREGAVRGRAPAEQRAERVQRDAEHDEQDDDDRNGLEGHRHRGAVDDRGGVDDDEGEGDHGRHEEALVHHGPLPVLAAEHPEHTSPLVAACNHRDQVGDHERCCRGTALGVVRIGDRKDKHNEDGQCKVATRCVDHGENGEVVRPPEDVAVHLLPATFVTSAVHTFKLLGVVGGVPREVALESLHEDDRDDRAEEEAEHEGVHDGEPVDLVLEELRVQVPVCPILEGLVGVVPDRGVGEVERGPFVHRPGVRGLHVHLDELVSVLEEREVAVREDLRERLALEVLGHRGRPLRVLHGRVVVPDQLREAADVHAELGMLS